MAKSFPVAPEQKVHQVGPIQARIGGVGLGTPVMLAPMAGVTNPPFRQLCREFGEAAARDVRLDLADAPAVSDTRLSAYAPTGLYVCEMITSRALVELNPQTMQMIQPDMGDPVRSIQLYGVEPAIVGESVRLLVGNGWAQHIDLNFGCPVPKVTRKGGGSALPWKHGLLRAILEAAADAAQAESGGRVPVTAKVRIGIDAGHETFREACQIGRDAGIAAITLHARTLTQHYSGTAQWQRIAELVANSDIPVFGNGDVFEAEDALRMLSETGAAGVVVGRGCQGRPWLFYDLVCALHGSSRRLNPSLREVCQIIVRHAELTADHLGDEDRAMLQMRKHIGWYLRGFAVGGQLRHELALVSRLEDLHQMLGQLEEQPFPQAASGPRGRAGGEKRAHLPEGWLESHELTQSQRERIAQAELGISGG